MSMWSKGGVEVVKCLGFVATTSIYLALADPYAIAQKAPTPATTPAAILADWVAQCDGLGQAHLCRTLRLSRRKSDWSCTLAGRPTGSSTRDGKSTELEAKHCANGRKPEGLHRRGDYKQNLHDGACDDLHHSGTRYIGLCVQGKADGVGLFSMPRVRLLRGISVTRFLRRESDCVPTEP
jgi:hypothetical protein